MNRFAPFLLALALALPAYAAADPPAPPDIILPSVAPSPPTPPAPPGPMKLAADQVYVAQANVPAVLRIPPKSKALIKVTQLAGPVTIARTKFADGSGYETRTLTAKTIWLIEAAGVGTVEISVSKVGATDDSGDLWACLAVDNGGPAPPIPPPGPPTPPVPTDPLTVALQAAYAAETDTTKAAAVKRLASIYRIAATPDPLNPTVPPLVNDPKVLTWADLFSKVSAMSAGLLPKTAIPTVRKAIGDQETALLGGGNPTGAIDRAVAAREYLKIATALEALK